MMTNNQNDFYIDDQEGLNAVISLIKSAKIVALDTEFTRETTYYPILSIIQVAVKNSAGKKESFILDCLSNIDLKEFFDIIADPKIIKIMHSSAQDLQIFHNKSNLLPQNIADTQMMANFCDLGFSIGYSGLTEIMFDQILDKKQQRSNWQLRPLSQKQIKYALLDVFYLEEIYENLTVILENKNRVKWCLEEMQSFIQKSLFKSNESLFKNFTFKDKTSLQASQIQTLTLLRERWAQKINVPRQHLIKDELIEEIILTKRVSSHFRNEMLVEIKEVLAGKISDEKNFEKTALENKKFFMNDKQKSNYLEAKKIINKISTKEGLKEQFMITSPNLKRVICEEKLFEKLVYGWRYQVFGEELKQLIS